jgi:hypothetical protein
MEGVNLFAAARGTPYLGPHRGCYLKAYPRRESLHPTLRSTRGPARPGATEAVRLW